MPSVRLPKSGFRLTGGEETYIPELFRGVDRSARQAEDSPWIRAATFVAVAIGIFASAWFTDLKAPAVIGIAGVAAGSVFSHFRRRKNNWWVKVILTFGILYFGTTYIYRMFYSPQYHILTLTELLIYLQILHSFDLPRRKDLMYSVISALMLLCVGGVFSRTMLYGLFVIAFILIALWMFMLYHLQELSAYGKPIGKPSELLPMGMAVAGIIALFFPVFFLFIPRVNTRFFAGLPTTGAVRKMNEFAGEVLYPSGPEAPGGEGSGAAGGQFAPLSSDQGRYLSGGDAYFGFVQNLDLNYRGRLSDALVMRVQTDVVASYRGLIFDRYTGSGWTITNVEGERIAMGKTGRQNHAELRSDETNFLRSDDVYQTFYFEKDMPNIIYGVNEPEQIYFPTSEIIQDENGGMRAPGVFMKDFFYTVVSRIPKRRPDALSGGGGCRVHERFCQLPEGFPGRVGATAREVVEAAGAKTDLERIAALKNYLLSNYAYSLDIPPAPKGADVTDYFLHEKKIGFCEHFATALAVMARALNIPARLATGFSAGRYNPFTGMFEVHGYDAHAWVEAYVEGSGWLTFDPTPGGLDILGQDEMNPMESFLKEWRGRLAALLPDFLRKNGWAGLPRFLWEAVFLAAVALISGAWLRQRKRTKESRNRFGDGAEQRRLAVRAWTKALRVIGSKTGVRPADSQIFEDYESRLPEAIQRPARELNELYDEACFRKTPFDSEKAGRAEALLEEIKAGLAGSP